MVNRAKGLNDITVTCYSGYTYAQEPRSFCWRGTDYEVKEIIKAWQEPEEWHFLVKTGDNKFFQLCYNSVKERWTLIG
jgi:hypothetical protein